MKVGELEPVDGVAQEAGLSDSDMLAGATGFEPVAFGFGVCTRRVHNPPGISPTLIEWHG